MTRNESSGKVKLVEVSQAAMETLRQIAGNVAVDKGSRNKVVVSHGWFKMFFCRGGLNCLTVRAIPLLIFV